MAVAFLIGIRLCPLAGGDLTIELQFYYNPLDESALFAVAPFASGM